MIHTLTAIASFFTAGTKVLPAYAMEQIFGKGMETRMKASLWEMTLRVRLHIVRLLQNSRLSDPIHYINGPETLPPPLTKEEESIVFAKLERNEPEARDTLVVHNLRLVVYIAKKFESTGIGIEDLISIGTIGLIKAVNTFVPSRNIKLATYASRCIENEILMYLRKNAVSKNDVSIDEPLNVDWDGNELLLSDLLGTEPDTVNRNLENEVEKELLIDCVNHLCPREKRIMEMRFGLNGGKEKTQKEVADAIGISQSYISRLEKRIIKRLKSEFEKAMAK